MATRHRLARTFKEIIGPLAGHHGGNTGLESSALTRSSQAGDGSSASDSLENSPKETLQTLNNGVLTACHHSRWL